MTPEQDRLEVAIGRLENRLVERLNTLEAKINNQRILIIVAIIGVIAQILNAWIPDIK